MLISKMNLIFIFLLCALKINAMDDPIDFKDYMAALLDNDKWVHLDSELHHQQEYCFFGHRIGQNKPRIGIKIDDYVLKFHEKLKWIWLTTQNSSDEFCLPGWERIPDGMEKKERCYIYPEENMKGKRVDYWEAQKICLYKYGGVTVEPWTLLSNNEIGKWIALKVHTKHQRVYWIGVDKEQDGKNWRYHSTGKKVFFKNWAPGQPNKKKKEKCVAVELGKKNEALWHDHHCLRDKLPFACEAPFIPRECEL